MIEFIPVTIVLVLFICLTYVILSRAVSSKPRECLMFLGEQEQRVTGKQVLGDFDWRAGEEALLNMVDRLGKAGFLSNEDRRRAWFMRLGLVGLGLLSGCLIGLSKGGFPGAVAGAIAGVYMGLLIWLYYLRYRTAEFSREVLFQLPLLLESIILLVESGVGILPSLEKVVAEKKQTEKDNPAERILGLVYQLASHRVPLGQALEMVANATTIRAFRHVLLHLDISGTEGGELIPSLRSLAGFAHNEWKLSVESRVRRLENMVVFPVFASVIGLMLLTASVPIVPVLELREKIGMYKSASPQLEATGVKRVD